MPEMHFGQPRFMYNACEPFTKNKEHKEYQKQKNPGNSRYIYQNKLDKACFQHDMAYGDFKDLPRRTASDKVLHDTAFNTAKNPKYDVYHRVLLQSFTLGGDVKSEIIPNQELVMNYTNQLLENLTNEKYAYLSKTIFGVLILIC